MGFLIGRKGFLNVSAFMKKLHPSFIVALQVKFMLGLKLFGNMISQVFISSESSHIRD
jgi:hypothetical protein